MGGDGAMTGRRLGRGWSVLRGPGQVTWAVRVTSMALVGGVGLAACGSSGPSTSIPEPAGASSTVWHAVDRDTQAGTAHFTTTAEVEAGDPGEGVVDSTMAAAGVVDFGQSRAHETLSEAPGGSLLASVLSSCPGRSTASSSSAGGSGSQGSGEQTQIVFNQQAAYMPPPAGCQLPSGKATISVSLSQLTPNATALVYLDPIVATEALANVRGRVERLETTSVGGVAATHEEGQMPAGAILTALGLGGQQLIDATGKPVSQATVQWWTDSQGRMVQWLLQGTVSINRFLNAEGRKSTQGTIPSDLRPVIEFAVRCTLTNLGSPVQVPELDPSQAVSLTS
jgi:hypothetical protein